MTDVLARTIDADVVPRLVLAERAKLAAPSAELVVAPPAGTIEELVRVALDDEFPVVMSFVDRVRAKGLSLESVYLELLTPAVRQLGELWDEDLADLGQATIATERLRQVMRTLSMANQNLPSRGSAPRRALLVPAPGDQHSFGMQMVAEFFGRAGWQFWAGVPESTEHMIQMVRREAFSIIGFSLGSIVRLDALSEAIRKVRRLSRNRGIGVMVGGPMFLDRPELVALVGAHATASDGRRAVLQANMLLELAQTRL